MNQSNSTIDLSSSSQPEIRQGKVALYMKSHIDKIAFIQNHPNGKKVITMLTSQN